MFYSESRPNISDADGNNSDRYRDHRRSSSAPSIDDTTLQDDDPIDRIRMDVDVETVGSADDDEATKYDEKFRNERNAINDAQSVRFTAYTMKQDNGHSIVNELRNVGVTVLSLESLSTSAMIDYMDAVTSMRLGEANDEKCMLYTDRMGRVFNVVISVSSRNAVKCSVVQCSTLGYYPFVTIFNELDR